ncbi:M20/M25/M40 family metallo-hydrolase [Novosphingobium sp. G106]|uniref:M20/M25/M40 family metallo-hydrolase n=1 Tax=Novosphingobium sp. G106 TaxID=2849500 RepID=UPI001C2D5942|nr:M20/M25/M40 family metallo-hydrolase [Novosphingobium sp. G106]MBV1689283.1 M20/M25/M40 family metallo-hydrolase [Novosphingobium sp. G106]
MLSGRIVAAFSALALLSEPAAAAPLRPDQQSFFELYKELVETNTTASVGSCTQAAAQLEARLRKAGFGDTELFSYAPPENPRHGNLVATMAGSDKNVPAVLLLAHLDVVEANRADWERDPFKLTEEGGFYFARGSTDDKSQAAIFTDTLIRLKQSGFKPRRMLKLALTCGEEGGTGSINGAEWLARNRPDLIAAGFALNEGGPGRMAADGGPLNLGVQVGEKAPRSFTLETTNKGGHSSVPVRDNAIYQLADAVLKVRELKFPLRLTPVTKLYFQRMGALRKDAMGAAMIKLAADPTDSAAEALVSSDRSFNSMLHTTCVATEIGGGHAINALPQRAKASINCRILPGETVEETEAALVGAIADPGVKITLVQEGLRTLAIPPTLDPAVMDPMERLTQKHFPGVPLIPMISTGATDSTWLGLVHIPTYGIPGLWTDPETVGTHGLNERVSIRALYEGRDYMFDLIKTYAASRE